MTRDGQGVYSIGDLLGKQVIDSSMPLHKAQAFKFWRNNHHFEVCLRVRWDSVHMTLVQHLEVAGAKGCRQFLGYSLLNGHRCVAAGKITKDDVWQCSMFRTPKRFPGLGEAWEGFGGGGVDCLACAWHTTFRQLSGTPNTD